MDKLPMQKCMVQVFHELTKLPVTVVQHDLLFAVITAMTGRLQQLNLTITTIISYVSGNHDCNSSITAMIRNLE